jgi:hypothetical protein
MPGGNAKKQTEPETGSQTSQSCIMGQKITTSSLRSLYILPNMSSTGSRAAAAARHRPTMPTDTGFIMSLFNDVSQPNLP